MLRKQMIQTVAPLALLLSSLTAYSAEYKVDTAHSKVGFSVPHMKISNVTGQFKEFSGTFTFDPAKGTVSNANFVVKTKSIDTNEPKRDDHLRGPDFFDVEKYPEMTFTNSKLAKASGKNKFKWTGDLTLHGVTKPVTFDLEHKGTVKDPWGNTVAGFAATTKINRKDFGLAWNKVLETGGLVVGEEVTLNLDVEAHEQKPAAGATTDAAPSPTPEASPAKGAKKK